MSRRKNWSSDKYGRIEGVAFHDGLLAEFSLSENKTLRIQIRNSFGGITSLELTDVMECNIFVCLNAIVADIFVWKSVDAPSPKNSAPDVGWNRLFADHLQEKDILNFVDGVIRSEPQSYLVQIDCSYGGRIAALCKNLVVCSD